MQGNRANHCVVKNKHTNYQVVEESTYLQRELITCIFHVKIHKLFKLLTLQRTIKLVHVQKIAFRDKFMKIKIEFQIKIFILPSVSILQPGYCEFLVLNFIMHELCLNEMYSDRECGWYIAQSQALSTFQHHQCPNTETARCSGKEPELWAETAEV